MNILVPISWLKDFLKTDASTEKIAEALSLCSQSVENIQPKEKDEILEIEITVNRYDCLSIIGMAREAAACLPQFGIKAKFKEPKIPPLAKVKIVKPENQLSVEIKDFTLCPRFSAILIDNVKIGPSPQWLVDRLAKVGTRSINNVVDISNYLMIETGQPIHTFDFNKILGQKMIMRLSQPGEKIVTLDGVERDLPGEDIVIEDGAGRLIDLCGIMGGQNSEISSQTKKVLFFVQAYDPVRIRKTANFLAHRTQAASRFERGIDLEGIIPVIKRGAQMMKELAGGKVVGQLIDIYPKKQCSPKIKVEYKFIRERLGIPISPQKINEILTSLEFILENQNKDYFLVKAPSFRSKDISLPEDILEEIARIYGYFRLPSKIPPLSETFGLTSPILPPKGTLAPAFKWEQKAKYFLSSVGFAETYNFSFYSSELGEKCFLKADNHLKLKNPLTADLAYMRTSLFPSLLNVLFKNVIDFPKINIFEMANVYLPRKNSLPEEKMRLTGISNAKDFSEIKGIVLSLFKELGILEPKLLPVTQESFPPFWQKNTLTQASIQGKSLGYFGQIANEITTNFIFSQKIFAFDLDFATVAKIASETKVFTSIPKYPPIIEDLALEIPEKTPLGSLIEAIKQTSTLIKSVDLLDSFNKIRTFRITYQHPARTLTDKEVKKVRETIIASVALKFQARVREVS